MLTSKDIVSQVDERGFVVVDGLLTSAEISRLKSSLEVAIEKEAEFHGTKQYSDYGMVLACPLYDRSFVEVLANERIMQPFEAVLGEGCIVYAYTSSSIPPRGTNYSRRLHVDCPRVIPGYVTNMGMTLALDRFTEENGAPWFLPNSHKSTSVPSESEFYSRAHRFTAEPGSAIFFNARVWHTSDINRTSNWRHALTINMCRPYMKQRIDLPRLLERVDLAGIPEKALQKLGFFSQVPASYEEYYQPLERRKYRQKVE